MLVKTIPALDAIAGCIMIELAYEVAHFVLANALFPAGRNSMVGVTQAFDLQARSRLLQPHPHLAHLHRRK